MKGELPTMFMKSKAWSIVVAVIFTGLLIGMWLTSIMHSIRG
jgi:hypothetical protein